jgi:HEAT repeat protein
MPLIKRDSPSAAAQAPATSSTARIAALSSAEEDARWNAARALHQDASAVPALVDALRTERVPRVREAIMTALMRIGGEASVSALLPYLRSQNAAERACSIAALQAMPDAVAPFMAALLGDADVDVRILTAELARGLPAAEATRLLSEVLSREPEPNVCAAAVEVLAEVGTRAALPALKSCGERFANTPFLPFAISVAMARISDSEG